ncbi:hypothetical protein KEG38_14690 [Polyangium jinanense]|uniref:hypothetical protein n=1 Tax=Polyangium jinanense TaxID=2829994 RepID=UPI002341D512|nr:hypothetical protein [Polyangium jinanense]MDC3955110.1 hypothetical protein [Polyangium jinanense]
MPRPFCFTLPYARFSPAHALASLEEAMAVFPDARIARAVVDMEQESPQGLDVDIELGPSLLPESAGEATLTGTLSVRFDGQMVSLVIDPRDSSAALPAIFTIAETMLASVRDLAAVAAGQDAEEEEDVEVDVDPWSKPASFDDLARRARHLFSLDGRGETAFGVTIAWQKPVGRTQGLLAHAHTPRFEEENGGEATWVTLESPVCPKNRLTPEEALRRSRSLDVGALCERAEHYTIVARYPLRVLDRARFVAIAMAIAEQADRLEAMLTGGKDEF